MNNIQGLLAQFLGGNTNDSSGHQMTPANHNVTSLRDRIPGGLVGGAAAGGIIALLLGNKKARKNGPASPTMATQ